MRPRATATPGLRLYRAAWTAFNPAAPFVLKARVGQGKEDPHRLGERLGRPARPRTAGTLIWIHGASVGEALSALPLVEALLEKPGRHVLVTTGTVTSALLMAERLGPRAFHQYVPIDARAAVRRFLAHWRPDLALFVESELWPNLIVETHARGVPMALVNARLSERSFRSWGRAKGFARTLLGAFDTCLAQDEGSAARLAALGARVVTVTGSLKADAAPLPVDETALTVFLKAASGRRIFLAASTHPGEDEIILDAANTIRSAGQDILTVIVPRHPSRGADIETLGRAKGFTVARRASSALPGHDTTLYVADTLGELGLFYRATDFVFMGGSLVKHGGQNPLEAARLETAILSGPFTDNFANIFEAIFAAQGQGRISSAAELSGAVAALASDPATSARLGSAARDTAQSFAGALAKTAAAAETLLAHARA